MANWCYNIVLFEGDEQILQNLETYFTAMAAKEKEENRGQLPAFGRQDQGGHFFYTRYEQGVLYYETKWAPNTTVLKEIADHFKAGFIQDYSEIDMQVYGQVTYRDGMLKDISLETEDFDLFTYNREEDNWLFEGNSYGFDEEILEILLDRKKAAQENKPAPQPGQRIFPSKTTTPRKPKP